MISIANKAVNDPDTAKDIVQEVFVYLFNRLNGGKEIQHYKSWLTRATINKCIDRTSVNKRFHPMDPLTEPTVTENAIEIRESRDLLLTALGKLEPKERILLILYSEGYSYKEIAATTGTRFSSVGKKLSRTLQKMKNILEKLNYEMH